jgi:hypothetical protein
LLVERLSLHDAIGQYRATRPAGSREPRQVAIRIVEDARNDRAAAWVRHEYDILVRLDHPGIPRAYGYYSSQVGVATSLPPTVMLESIVAARRAGEVTIDVSTALDIVHEVAIILRHAHSVHGPDGPVCHSHLHPGTIGMDKDGTVIVVGFGAAPTDTPHGYKPPEQVLGAFVDARSDQWRLGALIIELLLGVPPYTDLDDPGAAAAEGLVQPWLRRLERRFPEVARLVQKLLSPAAGNRYDNEGSLIRDLLEVMRHQANPPSRRALLSQMKAVAEAKTRREHEAAAKAKAQHEAEAIEQAEADARAAAEAVAIAKAEAEAKAAAEAEFIAKAEAQARLEAEAVAIATAEAEAKTIAEAELKAKTAAILAQQDSPQLTPPDEPEPDTPPALSGPAVSASETLMSPAEELSPPAVEDALIIEEPTVAVGETTTDADSIDAPDLDTVLGLNSGLDVDPHADPLSAGHSLTRPQSKATAPKGVSADLETSPEPMSIVWEDDDDDDSSVSLGLGRLQSQIVNGPALGPMPVETDAQEPAAVLAAPFPNADPTLEVTEDIDGTARSGAPPVPAGQRPSKWFPSELVAMAAICVAMCVAVVFMAWRFG